MTLGKTALFLAMSLFALPVQAGDSVDYAAATLGSYDSGDENLQNFTPGIALGSKWKAGPRSTEIFAEIGLSRNAYKEISPSLELGLTTRVTKFGKNQLRAGFGVGVAYFDELSGELDETQNYPNYEGYIPTVSGKLSLRRGLNELRLSIMPTFSDKTGAISTFSLSRDF